MNNHMVLILLILLQVKHFLFDFVFQNAYQLRNKGTYGHPGGFLHSGLHGLGTAVILIILHIRWPWVASIVALEILFHYHLDWSKEQLMKQLNPSGRAEGVLFWRLIGLDQLLHQLSYLVIVSVLFL